MIFRIYKSFDGVESNEETKELIRWTNKKEEPQIARISPKVLSVIELKEIMDLVFENKYQFDQNCIDNNFARDSMEQYMFFFFKKKFGMNNLIVEWMYSIIEAIKKYSSTDSEVAFFGLVLRNEINEEYYHTQIQLKFQLEQCLSKFLEIDNPNKSPQAIETLMVKTKETKLKEERVIEMINFMYDDIHPLKQEILDRVSEKIEEQTMKIPNFKEKPSKKTKTKKMVKVYERGILYEDLENLVLQVDLKSHYMYLENLISLFREYDRKNYGYVSIKQFIEMVSSVTKSAEVKVDVNEILKSRESYDPNVLTFSDLVNVFSEYMVKVEEQEMSFLGFISNSE
jgi:Ca2+-binding EF-hand superfamily protein